MPVVEGEEMLTTRVRDGDERLMMQTREGEEQLWTMQMRERERPGQ